MSVVLTENAVRRNELYYRHCEEQSDEAIHFFPRIERMDCFAEPVIGRAFARPVGSQ
jgi:hypothetical protein